MTYHSKPNWLCGHCGAEYPGWVPFCGCRKSLDKPNNITTLTKSEEP